MKRKSIILATLLAILLALLAGNLKKSGVKRVDKLIYKTGDIKTKEARGGTGLPVVKKELLSAEREKFRMVNRNIFEPLSFVEKKPRPKPKPVKTEPKPEPAPPAETKTVMEKAVETFTFLGFMEAGKVKNIFLTREDETFIVKKGDTLPGDYVVKSITDSSIEISTSDGSEILEISLVENKPLRKK